MDRLPSEGPVTQPQQQPTDETQRVVWGSRTQAPPYAAELDALPPISVGEQNTTNADEHKALKETDERQQVLIEDHERRLTEQGTDVAGLLAIRRVHEQELLDQQQCLVEHRQEIDELKQTGVERSGWRTWLSRLSSRKIQTWFAVATPSIVALFTMPQLELKLAAIGSLLAVTLKYINDEAKIDVAGKA